MVFKLAYAAATLMLLSELLSYFMAKPIAENSNKISKIFQFGYYFITYNKKFTYRRFTNS